MYYLMEVPRPHYVSIKTGKKYFYRQDAIGADRMRALKQLEADDTPAPEPEPEPVKIVQPKPRTFDYGAQARIQLDEIKLHSRKQ